MLGFKINVRHLLKLPRLSIRAFKRFMSEGCGANTPEDPCQPDTTQNLVLGMYTNPDDIMDIGLLTPTGQRYNKYVCNRLLELLRYAGPPPGLGETKLFYNLDDDFSYVVVVGLGRQCQGYDVFEQIDEGKEAIRIAAGAAVKVCQQNKSSKIFLESFGHAESCAEGAALGLYVFQEYKNIGKRLTMPNLDLYDDCDWTGWQIGLQKAAAQNLARQLMDTPANIMTPTTFAQNAVELMCKTGVNVEVKVKAWAETMKMNLFLAVSSGSCEPPIFLELSYFGANKDERPVVLIGKGITYNSGGICLKNPLTQAAFSKGEMAGAACMVAAVRAVAALQLPINIRVLIPLCENMPGCNSFRPGDILTAANGKSIIVQTTDVAGRLSLIDTLIYAKNYWPRFIVDIGPMTRDTGYALGVQASAVWTNSETLWEYILAASMHTGDRVWRFPLWDHYSRIVTYSKNVTAKSYGLGINNWSGEGCRVAALLHEFVPCGDWMHIDNFGTMYSTGSDYTYLQAGMTGRPTRTLVEFLSQLVCNRE